MPLSLSKDTKGALGQVHTSFSSCSGENCAVLLGFNLGLILSFFFFCQKFRFDTEFKGMGAAEKQSATRMESVAHHAQKTEVLILIITEPKLRQNPCPFAECSSYYSKRPH